MFIKRNRTRHGAKGYQSVLLVHGKRVPAKRPRGRPRAGSPPAKTVVVHETLANLSRLPPELIIDYVVPEPATLLLIGPLALMLRRSRRRA